MYNGLIASTLLLIILIFFGIIVSFLINLFLVPIIMTPKKILKEISKIIAKNRIKTGKLNVYDLGSGDGRMLLALNKEIEIRKGIGIEISPILLVIAKIKTFLDLGLKPNIKYEADSLFDIDLTMSDIIYCHLSDDATEILSDKFKKELEQGTIVYSYIHKIPNRKKENKYELSNGQVLWEYIY